MGVHTEAVLSGAQKRWSGFTCVCTFVPLNSRFELVGVRTHVHCVKFASEEAINRFDMYVVYPQG